MKKYKVNSFKDNKYFLKTDSYMELYNTFKKLKTLKGKIIHVIGAPGTGKSTNIYYALHDAHLNVYDLKFKLKDIDSGPKKVFNAIFENLAEDLGIKDKNEIYKELSEFDALIIADSFHDSNYLDESSIGFSQWTDKNGIKSLNFYLLCIREYLRHRKEFKRINVIFQTAWRVYIRGKKYDIFTDFGILSTFLKIILKIFFQTVEISYSEKETINIVKMHIKDADEDMIKKYIKKYGFKPRFICHALDRN